MSPDTKPRLAIVRTPAVPAAGNQRSSRDSDRRAIHLDLAAEYRAKLSWSIFELAHEARQQAAQLVKIHEDMANDRRTDSPIPANPRSVTGRRALLSVVATPRGKGCMNVQATTRQLDSSVP